MSLEDPLFTLELETFGRGGHALMNGVPVLQNYRRQAFEVGLPVTHLMQAGRNSFGWFVFLEEERIGEGARAAAHLTARPRGTPKSGGERIASAAIDGPLDPLALPLEPGGPTPVGEAGPQTVDIDSRGAFEIARTVDLVIEVPRWGWVDAPRFETGEATRARLVDYFQRVHALIEAGDRARLEAIHAEKARELAAAFQIEPEEALYEAALPRLATDPAWRLVAPRWDEMQLETAAGGRLARLIGPPDGAVFTFEDETRYRSCDIWLRQQGDRLIIAR